MRSKALSSVRTLSFICPFRLGSESSSGRRRGNYEDGAYRIKLDESAWHPRYSRAVGATLPWSLWERNEGGTGFSL